MKTTTLSPFYVHAEFWVSPEGDDRSDGTRDAPLRTLRRAHEVLCELAARARGGDIAIVLVDGTYRLDGPLVFDSALFGPDGPTVRVVAAPGAAPVISGAVRIEGWTLHDRALNIYKAKASGLRSRQLYVNGQRAIRARTTLSDGGLPAGFLPCPELPTTPSGSEPYVIRGGIDFIPTELNPERWRDPSRWRNPHRVEAVIETQWKTMRVPVRAVSPATTSSHGRLTLEQPGWTNTNVFFSPNKDQPAGPGLWSFWQVTRFENAYEFLDEPGEWYLDESAGELFYIPRPGEDLAIAEVELPVLETLIEAHGTAHRPVAKLSFEGIAFRHATWLGPDEGDGYVADQSGFHLKGNRHRPNLIGHARDVVRTPGNLRFEYAHGIRFERNRFEHLGAVALDFGTGCQRNRIVGNRFEDISSAAIQLGGVSEDDHHPRHEGQYTRDNRIENNLIARTGRDYVDSAAIYIGFTRDTLIAHNTIREVPWSGIAIGWGWGLFDPGMFPGVPNATRGMWGVYDTPTPNGGNRILRNHISRFLENRWDGGAIYSCGQQGTSFDDALLVEGNVACDKRPDGGGNTFYSDGGSRYIVFRENALFDNPIGHIDLGPPPRPGDPLPYSVKPSLLNLVPYGSDTGGCRTYGDILYENNYWMAGLIPQEEKAIDLAESLITCITCHGRAMDTYSAEGFFNVCPFEEGGIAYPTHLVYEGNHDIALGRLEVPETILRNAGVREGVAAPVACGGAPAAGGASFPSANPGPSWNVPRVSLPGLFGMQPQYGQEWWYYVGTVYDSEGTAFSLHLQIARFDAGGIQIGYGITGIGWRDDAGRSHYLCGQGVGLGASDSRLSLASVKVPAVSDSSFSAHFVPLLEIVGRSLELHLNNPFPHGWDGWKFDYLPKDSNGAPVGGIGSRYALSAHGRGFIAEASSAQTQTAEYRVELTATDFRGTVMEGLSGYVGPEMFPGGGDIGLSSYECAQPHLRIHAGGSLIIHGKPHRIEGGYLWLDRQMIVGGGGATPEAPPDGTDGLKQYLLRKPLQAKPLYVGDWISIVLDDGRSFALAEFWRKSSPQWLTGTRVGKPPMRGFGNFYFAVDGATPAANGGLALKPRLSSHDDDWDFDVNILEPDEPETSPHWCSPATGKTYATAWRIDFSTRMQRQGLPPTLYLFAISDNCEIVPTNAGSGFFEGAARVYADRDQARLLGHAFVEQMGFD